MKKLPQSKRRGSAILLVMVVVMILPAMGVGGNPDVVIDDFGATITGDTRALRERNVLPPIAVPQSLLITMRH